MRALTRTHIHSRHAGARLVKMFIGAPSPYPPPSLRRYCFGGLHRRCANALSPARAPLVEDIKTRDHVNDNLGGDGGSVLLTARNDAERILSHQGLEVHLRNIVVDRHGSYNRLSWHGS